MRTLAGSCLPQLRLSNAPRSSKGGQSIFPRARSQSRRTSRGKPGRSGCSLPPQEARDAHQSSRGPAGGGDAAEQRTYRSWGDLWMNLRRNIISQRSRRDSAACDQARKVAARLRRPLGEGSGPLSPPLPGRAPAAPHHVGGAAAVPAAGLGFRNGKVHVPCGRARPGPDCEGHSGFARSPPLLSASPQPRSPFCGGLEIRDGKGWERPLWGAAPPASWEL